MSTTMIYRCLQKQYVGYLYFKSEVSLKSTAQIFVSTLIKKKDIYVIFSHLKLWIAVARHNFMWGKVTFVWIKALGLKELKVSIIGGTITMITAMLSDFIGNLKLVRG